MALKASSPWVSGLLVAVVVSLVLGALWVSRPDPPIPLAPAPAAAPVHVRTLLDEVRSERVTAYGQTLPDRHALLAAEQSGLVVWRSPSLEVGARVKAGDALLKLDTGRLDLAVAAAQAQLVSARAGVQLAQRELAAAEAERAAAAEAEPLARREAERQQELAASGDVPESIRDRAQQAWVETRGRLAVSETAVAAAQAGIEVAQAAVGQAQQGLEQAEDERARAEVRAPFDGEIAAIHAELGAWVMPGAPVAELVDRDRLRVHLRLSNGEGARMATDSSVRVRFPAYRLVSGEVLTRTVEVLALAPQSDPLNRSRLLECVMPNEEDDLPAGAFVEAEIQLGDRTAIWLRPSEFRLDREGPRAIVIRDRTAEVRAVQLGTPLVEGDGRTWHPVLAGLVAGETIAIDNLDSPLDGGPVLILEDLPATAQR